MMTKSEYSNATYNLHTFGLFNKDPYIGVGDPYVEPGADWNKGRHQGLNFVTRSGKTGLDATFDPKYKPLFSTGEYVEMDTLLEHQRVESGRKKISDKPFRPTSPTKWSSGKGSAYGYIGSMPPNLVPNDPYLEPSSLQKRERDKGLNMVSPSGRTGSQATLGKKYEWMADPYGGDEEKRTKLFGDDVKYNQSILRSRPSSAATQGVDTENIPSSHPRPATTRPQSTSRGGAAASASDSTTRPSRPSSASDAHNNSTASWRSPLVSTRAFAPYGGPPRLFDTNVYKQAGIGRLRPSSASRSSSASATTKHPRAFCGTSYTGRTFSKYPEHVSDPEKVVLKGQARSEKGFVPAGTTNHSMFTRPIMTHITHK